MVTIKDRLEALLYSIDQAARRSGRRGQEITLIAVTKTQPLERILEVVRTGLVSHLGENRVQEALEKVSHWPADLPVTWHLIGHLQRNKARKALELFDRIQSVDSPRLAQTLETILGEQGRSLPVLMELNSSGEAQKSGVVLDQASALADYILNRCPSLELQGVMTLGPLGGEAETRRAFAAARETKERLSRETGLAMPVLSMGMSGDYPWAIEEGSTMVRVGTAIFGARHTKEVR